MPLSVTLSFWFVASHGTTAFFDFFSLSLFHYRSRRKIKNSGYMYVYGSGVCVKGSIYSGAFTSGGEVIEAHTCMFNLRWGKIIAHCIWWRVTRKLCCKETRDGHCGNALQWPRMKQLKHSLSLGRPQKAVTTSLEAAILPLAVYV
jgi:hypothetical protein